MNNYTAVGIIEGFVDCDDAADYVRACQHVRDHGLLSILHGSLNIQVSHIAEMADQDFDLAVENVSA